jgi:hypothetical protein
MILPRVDALTIVVKEEHEEFAPTIPFKARLGLTEQLSGVNKRAVLIEQVHILNERSEKIYSLE